MTHMQRAEEYMKYARRAGSQGTAFDFISVCPPYEKVSYDELFDLLHESPLIHPDTVVVIEYAQRLSDKMRPSIGPLKRIKDKKYGRTFVAVYGPSD